MAKFVQSSIGLGDLPPTITADVESAYDKESAQFRKFWQITLKVTDACGLRCTYCTQYVEKNAVELTGEFLTELVDFVDSRSLTCGFLLTGGEPLHHKDFFGMIRPFSSSQTPFDVNTSLVGGKAKINALLSAGPRTIRFSLHTTTAEESSAFNGTDSWHTITANAALVANGNERPERVEVNTHVSNTNYRNTLDRLKWIASEFDVDDINIFPVYDLKSMHLSKAESQGFYSDVLPGVIEFAEKESFFGLKTRAMRLLGDPAKYEKTGPRYVNHKHSCHAGRSILYVDNFKDVYPCVSQQIHRSQDAVKQLGRLDAATDLDRIIAKTPSDGFDPNGNDVCVKHCPLFFSMVNQYVDEQ